MKLYSTVRGAGQAEQIIDKSREDNPLGFVMGKQAILPKLEEQILGKEVGDKFTAVLEAKDGYGEYDKTFVTEVDRKNFETENPIEIGMAFQAMTAMGPLIVRVTKITDDKITVDGNHELAGVRLHFDVELAEGKYVIKLIGVNAGIVKSVVDNVLAHSPNAIIVCVSNPMDTMTYLAAKTSGLPKNHIIGMGGALDSSRFKCYLSKALNANINDMPLVSKASYKGIPVCNFASKETLDQVVADTMVGGATLTKLLGTSAWYAPGAALAMVVESILKDQKKMIPSCVYLDGEYGLNDICIGVPAVIGRDGVEKIVEIELNEEEKAKFAASAEAVAKTNAILKEINAL